MTEANNETGTAGASYRKERTGNDEIVLSWRQIFPWLISPIIFALGLGLGYYLWGRNADTALSHDTLVAVATAVAGGGTDSGGAVAVTVDDDPMLGNPDAIITIIEFSDVQCPYCYRFRNETLPQIMEKYGDQVRFVARDFPLTSIHPQALPGAMAAECVFKLKPDAYFTYSTALFNNQASLGDDLYTSLAVSNGVDEAAFTQCYSSQETKNEVAKDFSDARKAGVNSTPHFFINGTPIIGAQPFEVFDQEIQLILESAGN